MSLLDTASLIVTPNGYKATKLYSVIPSDGSGDLSVTRATTATRVNASGLVESMGNNVPRLDYSNGTCPSLLVEPQRTNLFTYSEDYTNSNWTKENATISANSTTAPSGITTADLITSTSSSFSDILQGTSQSSGNTYTLSCYAKKGSSDWIFLRLTFAAAAPRVWFNVNTGTIGTIQSGLTATIESVGNGWYRCSVTGVASATPPADRIDIALANADASTSPSVGNSVYVWGAQMEAGSYATSYIPTTSASVTRNADLISKTGISSLIGQTEGTMFCDIYNTSNSNYGIVLSQTLGDYTNSIYFFNVGLSNQFVAEVFTGGVLQMAYAKGSTLSMGRNKIAITYKNNDFAVALNGVIVWADTLGSVPTTNNLDFTDAGIGSNYSYKVNAVSLWKTRLTNTQLAQLTTI